MDIVWIGGRLIVAGPDTVAFTVWMEAGQAASGIRMDPGVGPLVLGVPAHRLRDQVVPLGDVIDSRSAARFEAAVRSGRLDAAGAALAVANRRESCWRSQDAVLARTVFKRAADAVPAPVIARELGWSERTLRRYALEAFGYWVRTVRRVARLQRALRLVASGGVLADSAGRSGYADQAHMTRDFTAMIGVTPGSLQGGRQTADSGANRSTALPSGSSKTA
ncbi:MAG: helix-turn-helix domain-containing protein [Bifidobacteriaceae bacterium]|jgi:AraC-like DNA-binding protein|nr:helix-turn-helix domain-containing protein [Bifidobacteriaceae bacterium]